MKSKVKAYVFIPFLVAVFLLSACAGAGTGSGGDGENQTSDQGGSAAAAAGAGSSEKSGETVTIDFLHIFPEHQEVMDKTIAMFEAAHPNIKIHASITPWDKATQQLQTSIASNDAPDISFMWPSSMSSFVSLDAPLDLTPYLEADPEWKNSFLSDNILANGSVNGRVYNIPFRGSATYIAYNRTMFEENGWKEPATIEELEALMDQMLAKGITPFAIAGKPNGFQVVTIMRYFRDYNLLQAGILDDPEYLTARKTDIDGPYAEAFQKAKDWLNKGYFGKSPLAVTREQAQALFFQGQGAMIMLNNNELTFMREGVAGKFDMSFTVFPPPAGVERLVSGGFDGWWVYKGTKHPDETVEFLKFFSSVEVQKLWADSELTAMVVKGIDYADKDLAVFASYLADAGKYEQRADYNQGDLTTKNDLAFVDYLQDDSYTAERLEDVYNENTRKQIEDQ